MEICGTQVPDFIAWAFRGEARRRGISEEEMWRLVWDHFVKTHQKEIRKGFLRKPWLLLRPEARALLARTF